MQELKPGTRVRLRSASHVLRLRGDTGTVVRPDKWADYYVIHLIDRRSTFMRTDV